MYFGQKVACFKSQAKQVRSVVTLDEADQATGQNRWFADTPNCLEYIYVLVNDKLTADPGRPGPQGPPCPQLFHNHAAHR